MRSPQYDSDLAAMKEIIDRIRFNGWAMLKTLNKATPEYLNNCGYGGKTNAEAMRSCFRDNENKVEKVLNEFLKKYPD